MRSPQCLVTEYHSWYIKLGVNLDQSALQCIRFKIRESGNYMAREKKLST